MTEQHQEEFASYQRISWRGEEPPRPRTERRDDAGSEYRKEVARRQGSQNCGGGIRILRKRLEDV